MKKQTLFLIMVMVLTILGVSACASSKMISGKKSNLAALNNEIKIAQNDVDLAIIGNAPGDYSVTSFEILRSAIVDANNVTDVQSQSDVDAATNTLIKAIKEFTPINEVTP